MIIFYVFLAPESDSDIRFSPSRLDFAAHEIQQNLDVMEKKRMSNSDSAAKKHRK